jgi:serine/threonine-protein kinase
VSADPRIGTRIGEYLIESLLGRGGMSVVYLAEHVRLKRKVALKVLSPELAEDPTFRQRFVSEWERLAGLDHPNIIPIFEAGEADGLLYIAMRYVDTTDLKGLIRQEGRLAPGRALAIIAQVAGALDAAHARSLVHRDVKPANILIAVGAGPEGVDHAYLSDFGLTKHTESVSGLTKTGHFMGTIDYVAPEQISGKDVDGRTDQYALACVLHECLTGKVPFPREEETASLFAHLQDPPPRPTDIRPDLPSEIDEVIARAMAKDKLERYPTCTDLARAARAALQLGQATSSGVVEVLGRPSETVLASPPATLAAPTTPSVPPMPTTDPTVGRPPTPGPRGRGRPFAIIGAVIVVAVIAAIALTQLGGDTPPSESGATGEPSAEPSEIPSPSIVTSIRDDFDDPSTGWETTTKGGIERSLTPEGTYRYVFTAPRQAFVTSLGGVGGVDGVRASDVLVRVEATVVAEGIGGNHFGLACYVNEDSNYYLVIGSDGRWEIQKLSEFGEEFDVLNGGRKPAFADGEATYEIDALCRGGQDGTPVTLTLSVNGQPVGTAIDRDTPIPPGAVGIYADGQPGLVIEFDEFVFEELAFPSSSS